MIHWQARFPHYHRHLDPIISLLGQLGHEIAEGDGPNMLVAGLPDAERTRNTRRLILVEHGAGQTYRYGSKTVDPSGNLRPVPDVTLYLAPNRRIADHMAVKLPNAERMVVGSPAVEKLYWRRYGYTGRKDRVVFAVHWPSPIPIPEAGSSWPWSMTILKGLVEEHGQRVLAHAHPRVAYRMKRDLVRYRVDVEFEADWEVCAERARFLVADNSSIIWEAAAVGIPAVLIDPPNWNPDAQHGLRWGSEAASLPRISGRNDIKGLQPELADGIVYGELDGSTRRAVDAIVEHVAS